MAKHEICRSTEDMTELAAKRWLLRRPPNGAPRAEDFELATVRLAEPAEGEVRVRIAYHTVAPGVRAKLSGRTYTTQVMPGDPIPGVGVGIVETSRHPGFAPGDAVVGELGWATAALCGGTALQRLDPALFGDDVPIEAAIGPLGPAGLTAYFGLREIGRAAAGETVLISSASGTVGSIAGQIAGIMGCRAVGIAGSADKAAVLVVDLGFAAAIDYRAATDLKTAIAAHCPSGVHVYFDNVGGEISDAALGNMRDFGRVIVCGQTSEYGRAEPRGIRAMTQVVSKRLTLRGFIVYDFAAEFAAARAEIAGWLRAGTLRHRPTIIDGIDKSADAFAGLFAANSPAAALVRVGP
jgi:NADPH-dependent curcumin reductase CurA